MNSPGDSIGFFKHATAIVETNVIGASTRVWAFVHILPGAIIGADCNICDHVFVENDVVLGDRVTVKSGVQMWDGLRVADDVFIGPNATFTNDLFPRSKQYPEKFLQTIIDKGASIGANATILAGTRVGEGAMVGAGSVVTRDVPPFAVVVGNPAQIVRYVNARETLQVDHRAAREEMPGPQDLSVTGCKLWPIPSFADMRGSLAVAEFDCDLPFSPKRCFFVHSVPNQRVRGEHAHIECSQFLVAVHGSLSVVVDDSIERTEVLLDRPDIGLLIAPGVWGTQYKFSHDAVLCVFASHCYRNDDYIREYREFLKFKQAPKRP